MNWPPNAAAVLVTGASSGIGKACALALAVRGVHVFAGVRSEVDLQLPDGVEIDKFTPLMLDVTEPASIAAAVETVIAGLHGGQLIGLVNNAGIMISGPLECVSSQDLRAQFDINVVGQMAVTRAFLPLLRKSRGRIVNIGSTSGHIPSAFTGPYCASKYALRALTDVLRMELRPFGMHVALIEPGVIATPVWEKTIAAENELLKASTTECIELYGSALADRQKLLSHLKVSSDPPETVASAVLHALVSPRPKTCYVLGLQTKIKLILAKYLPSRVVDVMKALRPKKSSNSQAS